MKTKTNTDFEKSLTELEALVTDLEKKDVPLEDQLKAFEKGIALSRACLARLDEIEKKVEKLVKNSNGEFETETFT